MQASATQADERVKLVDGIEESLDYKIYRSGREQGKKKGLAYEDGREY